MSLPLDLNKQCALFGLNTILQISKNLKIIEKLKKEKKGAHECERYNYVENNYWIVPHFFKLCGHSLK